MSYMNNLRTDLEKRNFSHGSHWPTGQLNMPSSSIQSPHQPRTPMAYSRPPVTQRNLLTESEPLSPYSELQIPMTPMRNSHQLGPMNSSYLRSQETHASPYPLRADRISQNANGARMIDSRSMRISSRDAQATPYRQSSFTPQPQLPLVYPKTPQGYFTPSISNNPDQSFALRSTSANSEKNVSNIRKTEGVDLISMNTDSKVASQADKLTPINRKRFFIGSIDQIIHWNKLAKQANLYIIYEGTGVLENKSYDSKKGVYKLIFRDEQKTGSVLQAVFFNIDREIPEMRIGGLISFVGRMVGTRKLQVLNVWPTNPNSLVGLKRISFLCQRTLQEACLSHPEP